MFASTGETTPPCGLPVSGCVTAPALVEFLKELSGMLGQRPIAAEELEFSKTYITRGYPAGFETPHHVAGQLEALVQYRLPDDYFNTFVPKIRAVTGSRVVDMARKYLDVDHLTAVIVGDRAQIESSLRELPIGKNLSVVRFDENFRLAPVD